MSQALIDNLIKKTIIIFTGGSGAGKGTIMQATENLLISEGEQIARPVSFLLSKLDDENNPIRKFRSGDEHNRIWITTEIKDEMERLGIIASFKEITSDYSYITASDFNLETPEHLALWNKIKEVKTNKENSAFESIPEQNLSLQGAVRMGYRIVLEGHADWIKQITSAIRKSELPDPVVFGFIGLSEEGSFNRQTVSRGDGVDETALANARKKAQDTVVQNRIITEIKDGTETTPPIYTLSSIGVSNATENNINSFVINRAAYIQEILLRTDKIRNLEEKLSQVSEQDLNTSAVRDLKAELEFLKKRLRDFRLQGFAGDGNKPELIELTDNFDAKLFYFEDLQERIKTAAFNQYQEHNFGDETNYFIGLTKEILINAKKGNYERELLCRALKTIVENWEQEEFRPLYDKFYQDEWQEEKNENIDEPINEFNQIFKNHPNKWLLEVQLGRCLGALIKVDEYKILREQDTLEIMLEGELTTPKILRERKTIRVN
jgi:hypothetical protein